MNRREFAVPDHMGKRLVAIAQKRCPELHDRLQSPREIHLTEAETLDLRMALTCELIEVGLGEDDEPNAVGLALEELIDRLAWWNGTDT